MTFKRLTSHKILKGSPLVELAVKNFDEEQIWQELELQNDPALQHFEQFVENIVSDETFTVFDEEDEEELDENDQVSEDEYAEEEEDEEEEKEEEKEVENAKTFKEKDS
ncbi:hypothetical protein WMY93_013442 [Mugilogobius chulae]|uniref:Uncharacterized protein n=1 Tax=Mugilogobius chulae TaxID=88201 RepID=A0AAW0PCC5_9GOBI